MNYNASEIIDAALARLRAGNLRAMFPSIVIDEYDGEFLVSEMYEEQLKKLPAVLAWYGDETYDDGTADLSQFEVEAVISIIYGHRHMSGFKAAVRGAGQSLPGLLDMSREIRRLLAGNDLGLQINPLRPVRNTLLAANADGVVKYFEFKFVHYYDQALEA